MNRSDPYWWIFLRDDQLAGYADADKLLPNGTEGFEKALDIVLPSTVKKVGEYAFAGTFIEGLRMEWCGSVDDLPKIAKNAFSGATVVGQAYFSKEAIDAHGDEFDQFLLGLDDVGDVAWYDEGGKVYWSDTELSAVQ